jgi:hypothetical protein
VFVSRHEIRPSACRAICPGAAGRTLTLTIKACGHSRSIGLDTTFRICLRCALRVSFIVYNSYGHEWGHSVETFAERTTSHDKKSRRGAELSEAKTTPTSNKTTQTPSTNPDLRTVKSSMSSIQIRHSEQTVHSPHIHSVNPCRPLSKVSPAPPPPSMSRILTTPQYCNPTMRAGMELAGFLNGPAWSASLRRQARWEVGLVLCDVWCTQDDYSRLVFCWISCFGLA